MIKVILIATGLIWMPIHIWAQNELCRLDFLMGEWNVMAEIRLSAQGPWDASKGKAIIKKEVGSKVINEDHYGSLEGKSYITKSLLAYSKSNQLYQRVFADSEHGVFVDYTGIFKGDSLVFDKLFMYPDKSTVKLKVIYSILSKDEFIVEDSRMPESATGWDVTGRLRYKRNR